MQTLKVLPILESIRLRPGMYVGDVCDGSGLLHLIWEVVANSIDEHSAGRCSYISVEIEAGGAVVIEDDGRGIPVEDVGGVPFAQVALTSWHGTPTLDGHAPHDHADLRGVGLVAVNAVSSVLQLDSFHRGRHHAQRYERGVPISALEDLGPTERTGTRLRFVPDAAIFADTWINAGAVAARLRELACLLPSLTLSFADRRPHRFHEPRGLRGFLERGLPLDAEAEAEVFTVKAAHGEIGVEAAMMWHAHRWSSIESFANIERTTDGGSHVQGLLKGLVEGLLAAAGPRAEGADRAVVLAAVESGLRAVVCVRLQDPTYDAPTRSKLLTPKAAKAVQRVVASAFATFLGHTPRVLEHLLQTLAEREAAGKSAAYY